MGEMILSFCHHHLLEESKLPKAKDSKDIFITLYIIFAFHSIIGSLWGKQGAYSQYD